MAVANFNRKILDLKRWTMTTAPLPLATAAGHFFVSSRLSQQRQLLMSSATVHYLYYPFEDGFIQIPSGGLAGAFGAGACGTAGAVGPTGNALAGAANASELPTNLTLGRNIAGYQVMVTAGPGAGDIRTIANCDVGANAKIRVTVPFSATPTVATAYRLLTPRYYVLNAGTIAAGSFKVFCFALNAWITLAQANLPATWGTDGRLIGTPSWGDRGEPVIFATGTATGGGASTIIRAGKTWTVNQWTNSQLRIVSGAGAGQIRTIASNTADTLTVSVAWATVPDATSVYVIEGNDDFLYLMGNGSVSLYRYQISTNTWTVLTPGVARAAAPGVGMSGHWVFDSPDSRWLDENAIVNGRRIYSFRGGGSAALDYFDIAAITWVSAISYAPGVESFSTGSKYVYADGYLYMHKDITGRWFRYSFADQAMIGFSTNIYPGGAGVAGDTAFDVVEPESGIRFIYHALNTSTAMMRCMVI